MAPGNYHTWHQATAIIKDETQTSTPEQMAPGKYAMYELTALAGHHLLGDAALLVVRVGDVLFLARSRARLHFESGLLGHVVSDGKFSLRVFLGHVTKKKKRKQETGKRR